MNPNEILEAIDQEISKLQHARELLAESPTVRAARPAAAKPLTGKRRGRPKGSVSKKAEVIAPVATNPAKRIISAEGKARIAAAQKARWAKQKKASLPARSFAKKTPKKAAVATKKAVAVKRTPPAESAGVPA